MPYRCVCGFELRTPASFCLNCGERWAIGCAVYNSESKIHLFFVGKLENEVTSFKKYDDEVSVRNAFEIVAERIHDRRICEIVVSGRSEELIEEASYHLRNSLFPFSVAKSDVFDDAIEFFERFERRLRTQRSLKKVEMPPEKKIHGSHSTIIGGREGYGMLLKLASSPYVKKIVPGVIENKGTSGGGVRFKMTRSDEKGNVKALLIDGATVQQIHVITTASSREEGEELIKILNEFMES